MRTSLAGLYESMFLTRRWLRSRGARRSALLLALTFAVLAGIVVSVSAFTLGPAQAADKEFGTYQQKTYSTVNLGELPRNFATTSGGALAAAAPGAHLMIGTDQVRPDALAKTYVQAPLTQLRLVEDAGLREAFPGRYRLDTGLWPESPFDVVVSHHLLGALPDPSQFTVLSGRTTLHVVGVVTDTYDEHGDLIVAGPGTWESLTPPDAGRQYQPVEAQITVLFGTESTIDQVSLAVQDLLPPPPADQGSRAETLSANYSTRADVAGATVSGFGTDQLAVSYLPLLLVVFGVSALVVGQTRSGHRSNADRLVALGVRRSRVRITQVVALTAVTAASIVVGLGFGWLVALVLRAAVLGRYAAQPLSPVPRLDGPSLALAGSTLVLVALGTLWPEPTPSCGRRLVASRVAAEIHVGLVRRVAALLLLIGAVQIGGSRGSVIASYLAVAAVLLAAPDALRVVLRALPTSNPRTFVTQRLMRGDLGRQAAAVIVVGACIAIPVCVATQLVSTQLSDATFTYSRIPAGQIWVQSTGTTGDATGAVKAVSTVPNIGPPVVVRSLQSAPSTPGGGTYTLFGRVASGGTDIMVLDSADQLERLFGTAAPTDATTVLDAGGVLDFTSVPGDQQLVTFAADGSTQQESPVLRTVKVSLPRQYTEQFAGAILSATATQLRIPVSDPTKYIYPHSDTALIASAVQAAIDAGYDNEFIQYAVPPPTPKLPATAYVFLAGLVLGGFAVLLTVIRGQARRLRTYSARLVALGLSPRWTLSVLGIQAAVTVGVGLLAGVTAGVAGIKITSGVYVVTAVPVLPVALACSATVLAAAVATALAVRALAATEHPQMT